MSYFFSGYNSEGEVCSLVSISTGNDDVALAEARRECPETQWVTRDPYWDMATEDAREGRVTPRLLRWAVEDRGCKHPWVKGPPRRYDSYGNLL